VNWEQWKAELVRLAGDTYGFRGPIEECGEGVWWQYFRDGYTPRDALDEDARNADWE
jgi:hypothetical protein